MSIANSFISDPLPIGSLIINRLRVLDLPRGHLLRRAGYKNIAKGLRRFDELLAGELVKTRDLIRALPAALAVPPEVSSTQSKRHVAEQPRPGRPQSKRWLHLARAASLAAIGTT